MGFSTPMLLGTYTLEDFDEISDILSGKIIIEPWYTQIILKIMDCLFCFPIKQT